MRSSSGVLNTSATSSRVQSVRTTPRSPFHPGCAAAVASARVPVARSACSRQYTHTPTAASQGSERKGDPTAGCEAFCTARSTYRDSKRARPVDNTRHNTVRSSHTARQPF